MLNMQEDYAEWSSQRGECPRIQLGGGLLVSSQALESWEVAHVSNLGDSSLMSVWGLVDKLMHKGRGRTQPLSI